MSIKPEVTKIDVIIYQRDVEEWHAIVFDVSDPHHRKWLSETVCRTWFEADQFRKDNEDFYLCDLGGV